MYFSPSPHTHRKTSKLYPALIFFYPSLCRGSGHLPPIVQQISCHLRPQRRVPASQLRRKEGVKMCGIALKSIFSAYIQVSRLVHSVWIINMRKPLDHITFFIIMEGHIKSYLVINRNKSSRPRRNLSWKCCEMAFLHHTQTSRAPLFVCF